jgi:phosphatidylinositol alpha-1,6-mannosyltransferase
VRHLLVTNDFPPKVGGIQSYLWELWRRLPPGEVTVLTTPWEGDGAFDAAQPFRVVRARSRVLLPTRATVRAIDELAHEVGAGLVVLDPALPIGMVGPRLSMPYAVVLHGAEVTVPGRLPVTRHLLARVLRGASHVIAAGAYPAAEGERAARRPLPVTVVPPGVDTGRFHPLPAGERGAVRARFGLPVEGRVVVSVSRLVPRKGMDVLIDAVARVRRDRPDVALAVGGTGRDRARLERIARRHRVPVRFLGRVPDADLPGLIAAADVFAMLCRDRWLGLEQEGFGIVFVEAAAAGVPQVAGDSGGAADAVVHGETGLVVRPPKDAGLVADALAALLDDDRARQAMGGAARRRAVDELSYDVLARRLGDALGSAPA